MGTEGITCNRQKPLTNIPYLKPLEIKGGKTVNRKLILSQKSIFKKINREKHERREKIVKSFLFSRFSRLSRLKLFSKIEMDFRVILLLSLLFLVSCSNIVNYPETGGMNNADAMFLYNEPQTESSYFSASVDVTPVQKILQNAHVAMHSVNFDETVAVLRDLAPNAGGFVESANLNDFNTFRHPSQPVRRREFSIVMRVPAENFNDVLRTIEGLAVVNFSNQSAEDVTAQYYDLASRLETKYIEEERVLDMISRAELIEDLLILESRLGQIRTDIERFNSQIINIDRLAAFSTIHVSVTEVENEAVIILTEGLGGRMGRAFVTSLNGTISFFQNVLIFLAGALIPLLFIGILCYVGFTVKRKLNV
jgi:hypothetical protein